MELSLLNNSVYLPIGPTLLYKWRLPVYQSAIVERLINSNPELLQLLKSLEDDSTLRQKLLRTPNIRGFLSEFFRYKGLTIAPSGGFLCYKGQAIECELSIDLATKLLFGYFSRPSFDLLSLLLESRFSLDKIDYISKNVDVFSNTVKLLAPICPEVNTHLLEIAENSTDNKGVISQETETFFTLGAITNIYNPQYVLEIKAHTSGLSGFKSESLPISISNGEIIGLDKISMKMIDTFTTISSKMEKLLSEPTVTPSTLRLVEDIPPVCYWGVAS